MRIISYIVILLIIILGITFASLNATPVAINYYLKTKTLPLSLLLALAFGAGVVLGCLFTFFSWVRLKIENSRLMSRLKVVEQEVTNLRSLPLKEE